jgi:Zn-dependent alcohol dehydrogenase
MRAPRVQQLTRRTWCWPQVTAIDVSADKAEEAKTLGATHFLSWEDAVSGGASGLPRPNVVQPSCDAR